MSGRDKSKVDVFRESYIDFCTGKDDDTVLIYVHFVEAVNKEILKQVEDIRALFDSLSEEIPPEISFN